MHYILNIFFNKPSTIFFFIIQYKIIYHICFQPLASIYKEEPFDHILDHHKIIIFLSVDAIMLYNLLQNLYCFEPCNFKI